MSATREEVLELWRGEDAHVDEGHPLGEAQYLLRRGDGGVRSASFPWSEDLHRDLEAIHGRTSAHARERVGRLLRDFFTAAGWTGVEDAIIRDLAVKPRPPDVRVTIRCSAGEMCRLPLELMPVQPSGEPLGLKDGCHVQWEWPQILTAPRTFPAPPRGGALLFAWSTAGGELDAAEQFRIIQRAAEAHRHPKKPQQIANVSRTGLRQALDSLRSHRESAAVLHLCCHGVPLPGAEGGYGLALNGTDGGVEVIDPATCATELAPYAGLVGCVVLAACDGANLANSTNFLGSVAQRLHRVGFPAVVASRAPLSSAGAEAFSEAFYDALLAGEPLHRAVAAGRRRLRDEWPALQVYGRAVDGPQYPVVFQPYRGLQSFGEADRRFFFGRERLTEALLERIVQASNGGRSRFQVVAGTSGSGKSSLVKAGLLPELRSAGWRIALLRPGGDGTLPERGLARLVRALRDAGGGPPTSSAEMGQAAAMAEARRLRERWPDSPLLVVVDQLEEAFRLEGDEPRRFLECLWRLARDETLKIVVLSTFRADLLERAEDMMLEPGVTLQTIVYRETHRLYAEGMDSKELLDAIQRPLAAVGLSFEPGLAEQIRDEAGKEPGALPLMQHALDGLWQSRGERTLTRAEHERLGGLTGALSNQLEVLWDGLVPEQQRQGHRLLLALVDIAKDTALSTRRRARVQDVRPSGAAAAAFDAVLEKLVERRLLVRGDGEVRGEAAGWVEIAHEALIRRWPRFQEWLKEEQQREQRAKVRRARLTAGGAVSALLVMAVLAAVAYAQRERARNAIAQALEVANEVVFTIDRDLENVGGAGPIRKKLLERVGLLQDRLGTASEGGDVASRRLRAVTHIQRGDVARSHDDLEKARHEYQEAFNAIEPLAGANPSNAKLQGDLAIAYQKLGEVAKLGGDLQTARTLFSKHLAVTEALARANPSDAKFQRDLSISYERLADVARYAGDLKSARELFSKDLAIAEALATANPSDAKFQRDLSISYEHLANVTQDSGDLDAARKALFKALALREMVAKADPSNAPLQDELSISYERLGEVAEAAGDLKAAREMYSKALAITEARIAGDPSNAQLKYSLSMRYASLASVIQDGGDLKAAREIFVKALAITEELAKTDVSNAELRRQLSVSYHQLGDVAREGGDLRYARELFSKALDISETLAASDSLNASLQSDLALSYRKLAEIEQARGDLKSARELYAKGVAICESLAMADPSDATLQRDLSVSYCDLGGAVLVGGNMQGAHDLYAKAVGIFEALVKSEPNSAALQRDLSIGYTRLAGVTPPSDHQAIRELYSKALAISEALSRADPSNKLLLRDLFVDYSKLGDVAEEEGALKTARDLYSKALGIAEARAKADPSNARLQRDLSVGYSNAGDVAKASGDLKAARELFSKDLGLTEALAQADPSNAELQRDLAISCDRLGDVAEAGGDLKAAREMYSRGLSITEALAKADPANARVRRDLAKRYGYLAEVIFESGDLKTARELFTKALAITEALAKSDPANTGLLRDLAVRYNRAGEMAQKGGDLEMARTLFARSSSTLETLVKAHSSDVQLRTRLAVSYQWLAGVEQARGDMNAAKEWCSKALAIVETLARTDPANASLQRDLSVSYGQLGEVTRRAGDLKAARLLTAKALAITATLARTAPSDLQLRRDLAYGYDQLGVIAQKQGDLRAARDSFAKAITGIEDLMRADPSSDQLRRNLALGYEQMGGLEIGNPTTGRSWIAKALDLRHQVVARNERDVDAQLDLAKCEKLAADIEHMAGANGAAGLHRDRAMRLVDLVIAQGHPPPPAAQELRMALISFKP